MYVYHKNEARSRNHCCSGKAINLYSECVFVALFAQHVTRMHLLPSVACPALQYFSTLSHKRTIFGKEVTEHEMCFDFLDTFCLKYLSF